jgi:Flp pilus assembly protein TadG
MSGVLLSWHRLLRSRRGAAIVKFAVSLPVVVVATGSGIDFGLSNNLRADLQSAADAAALAAVQNPSAAVQTRVDEGRRYFNANVTSSPIYTVDNPTITVNGNRATVTATGHSKNVFLGMVGLNQTSTTVVAEAVAGSSDPVELVVVIDTTASMNVVSYSFDAAKTELKAIGSQLLANNKPGEDPIAYFSVVPMSDRVNIGTARSAWLREAAPAGWNGCVEPRPKPKPGFPHFLNDDPAHNNDRFLASIPGVRGGLRNLYAHGPICTAPIAGPAVTYNAVAPQVDALYTSGTGRFDEGMAWAWPLLSKKWEGAWGIADYPNKNNKRRKVVVFISDAFSEAMRYENDMIAGEVGYIHNTYSHDGFKHLVEMCADMKREKIEINMFFMNGNAKGKPYFEQCASSPAHFFEITNLSDFRTNLASVSIQASPPRLVR